MACTYQIQNLANNKFYIGSTIRDSFRRRYEHFGLLRKNNHYNNHLQSSFNKYGEQSFLFSVLEDYKFPESYSNDLRVEYVTGREEYYVQLFNPQYNIKTNTSGLYHKGQAIDKIKARSNQEDNKKRIRDIQKIAARKRIGSHWSAEIKSKIVNTKFGKDRLIEVYTKKGNILYICNFSSEAAKLTGISRSAISNNLIGLSKSAGGLIFKYKDI